MDAGRSSALGYSNICVTPPIEIWRRSLAMTEASACLTVAFSDLAIDPKPCQLRPEGEI